MLPVLRRFRLHLKKHDQWFAFPDFHAVDRLRKRFFLRQSAARGRRGFGFDARVSNAFAVFGIVNINRRAPIIQPFLHRLPRYGLRPQADFNRQFNGRNNYQKFFARIIGAVRFDRKIRHGIGRSGNLDQTSRHDAIVAAACSQGREYYIRFAARAVRVKFAVDDVKKSRPRGFDGEPHTVAGTKVGRRIDSFTRPDFSPFADSDGKQAQPRPRLL